MILQLQRPGYSHSSMVCKADGTKTGNCGLYGRNWVEGIALGDAFLPDYERRLYAFEAASRRLWAACNAFGLQGLGTITNTDNQTSQRLLEKSGFRNMGDFKGNAEEAELLMYRIDTLP